MKSPAWGSGADQIGAWWRVGGSGA